jgi:hypothetical protein
VLTRMTDDSWPAYALTGGTLAIVLTTRVHPLWLLALGAALGAFGLA